MTTAPIFDKNYYQAIWGDQGVHRHDYTADLAERLIKKYGAGRILDIGTGCGHLVKTLREKGADAWGIDISQHAIENSCAPGFVLKASITDIPFKNKFFDLVHSQGVWGYFPEADIPRAWAECNRVGKRQEHNIDCLDSIPEHQYLLVKSREWWDQRLQPPGRVLVTCPTYEGKEYCFKEWIDRATSLTYPNYDILVVDNSPTDAYYRRWRDQVPMIHLDFTGQKDNAMYRVCRSMAEVQRHFLKGNYSHWMNIEADNIPPPNVIETLMHYGEGADWVQHCYPATPTPTLMQGIGCALFSRRLMTDFDWNQADDSPDSELWTWVQQQTTKYKTVELWYIMDIKHLK